MIKYYSKELKKHDDMFVLVRDENENEFVIDSIVIKGTESDDKTMCCHLLTKKSDGICIKR